MAGLEASRWASAASEPEREHPKGETQAALPKAAKPAKPAKAEPVPAASGLQALVWASASAPAEKTQPKNKPRILQDSETREMSLFAQDFASRLGGPHSDKKDKERPERRRRSENDAEKIDLHDRRQRNDRHDKPRPDQKAPGHRTSRSDHHEPAPRHRGDHRHDRKHDGASGTRGGRPGDSRPVHHGSSTHGSQHASHGGDDDRSPMTDAARQLASRLGAPAPPEAKKHEPRPGRGAKFNSRADRMMETPSGRPQKRSDEPKPAAKAPEPRDLKLEAEIKAMFEKMDNKTTNWADIEDEW